MKRSLKINDLEKRVEKLERTLDKLVLLLYGLTTPREKETVKDDIQ